MSKLNDFETVTVGIMSPASYKERTLQIVRGEYIPKDTDPKLWIADKDYLRSTGFGFLKPLQLYKDADWTWSVVTEIGTKYVVELDFKCNFTVTFYPHWYLDHVQPTHEISSLIEVVLDQNNEDCEYKEISEISNIECIISEHHARHILKLFK